MKRGEYLSVARSTYLHQGTVRITNNGKGYVGIFGGTECNVSCNTVKLNVYLERSSGSEDFYSYKKWENVDYNTNSLYLSKEIKVEKGYYYRLRGYHSCTKNGVTESGGSRTDGIYIGKLNFCVAYEDLKLKTSKTIIKYNKCKRAV